MSESKLGQGRQADISQLLAWSLWPWCSVDRAACGGERCWLCLSGHGHVTDAGLKLVRTLLGIPAWLWLSAQALLGGRVQAANWAAKPRVWCGMGQPGGFVLHCGLAWEFVPAGQAQAAGRSWSGFCWASTDLEEA